MAHTGRRRRRRPARISGIAPASSGVLMAFPPPSFESFSGWSLVDPPRIPTLGWVSVRRLGPRFLDQSCHLGLESLPHVWAERTCRRRGEGAVDRSRQSFYLFKELAGLAVVEESRACGQQHVREASKILARARPVVLICTCDDSVINAARLAVDDQHLHRYGDGTVLSLPAGDEFVEQQRGHPDDQQTGDDVAGERMVVPPGAIGCIPELSGN